MSEFTGGEVVDATPEGFPKDWAPPAPKTPEQEDFDARVAPLLLPDGSFDDARAQAEAWKAVGNALFKDGEHAHAIAVYGRAAARLCARAFAGRASDMDLDPDGGGFAIACASNAALCALKLGDARAALAHCDRALEALDRTPTPRDAARAKVLYRRALACLETGQARQALDHLGESAKLDASAANQAAVRRELARAKKALKAEERVADRALFGGKNLLDGRSGLLADAKADAARDVVGLIEAGVALALDGDEGLAEARATLDRAAERARALKGAAGARLRARAELSLGLACRFGDELDAAEAHLDRYFAAAAGFAAAEPDWTDPPPGRAAALDARGAVLFEIARRDEDAPKMTRAKDDLLAFLAEVERAGELEAHHNMPDSWLASRGLAMGDFERKVHRYKYRLHARRGRFEAMPPRGRRG